MKVKGFKAAAVEAGVRYQNRLDLALIYSEIPTTAAAVFTTNKVKAAPVKLSEKRIKSGSAQAVIVNSGNANACTGTAGMELAEQVSSLLAAELAINEDDVQIASTGVIGEPLPLQPFADNIPRLVSSLSEDGFDDVARAIMTTDTFAKTSYKKITIAGKEVSLLGIAKGSGMIMPNMATMLCFLLTDANLSPSVLQTIVSKGAEKTFNRITVDGDTSTNDMVLIMANGAADNPCIDESCDSESALFASGVEEVFLELAKMIVKDGEGATKFVTIEVAEAFNEADALAAARTIANSLLVKTAIYGEDPNWGRIIAALGRSGCKFKEETVSIMFDEVEMVKNGLGQGPEKEKQAALVMKKSDFTITIKLGQGRASEKLFTCDLSDGYVKINADYRS